MHRIAWFDCQEVSVQRSDRFATGKELDVDLEVIVTVGAASREYIAYIKDSRSIIGIVRFSASNLYEHYFYWPRHFH